ncbi:orotate phosphoribosyltransferase [Candidatus Peregrinibacteria bacterium]|nr:orotate phosphoribosyltransferase [Candidatus Peregrinibacteria bacterium]
MDKAKEIAEILLDIGAVKVKINPPFTWVSGIKSPVYCDNRKLISYPKERGKIVKAFVQILRETGINPEFIGGTATAAIPWAAFLAYEMNLPMIYIRPEKKQHGAGQQVEGELSPGKRVLILEDLISTGGSSVKAAQAVQNECKGVVSDIFAIVSWELDESKRIFQKAELRLTTLTNFSNIIGLALERKVISQEEWGKILEFKKSPRDWAAKVGY